MKPLNFQYFPDSDTLYIELKEGPAANVAEVNSYTLLDLDQNERVVGITLDYASQHLPTQALAQHIWNKDEDANPTDPARYSTADAAEKLNRSVQWVKKEALAHNIGEVVATPGRGQRRFTGADLIELRKHIKYKKPQDTDRAPEPRPAGG